MRYILLSLALAVLASGCGPLFGVNIFVVGEQTALEQQVLGTYESLGQDLTVYASVRGVEPDGTLNVPPPTTASQEEALQAMRNREYNSDDVDLMLREGIVGEANDGLIVRRVDELPKIRGLRPELLDQVIQEENRDRQTLIARLMQTTPGVTEDQRSEVAWIFANLNQDLAPQGSWVQQRDGSWVRK